MFSVGDDDIYGDFTGVRYVDQTLTETRSFEPGLGTFGWVDDGSGAGTTMPGTSTVAHYHSDLIGTTRRMSDSTGAASPTGSVTYTAFGERISGTPSDRYGYAGSWGYQSHDDFPFLHVGARYYDPATGRFLQRDPIGIDGGLNVYGYARSSPLFYIDPSGLGAWGWIKKKAKKVWDVAKRLPPYILPSSPVPAAAAPAAACAYMRDAKRRHALKDHEDGLTDPNCPKCKRLTPKRR